MTEPIKPAADAGEQTIAAGPPAERSRLVRRLLGLALVITSVVLATYLLVAYFAFETGQAERVAQETTARDEQIERQIELARQDLAEDSAHLALTRLDWVLAQAHRQRPTRPRRPPSRRPPPYPSASTGALPAWPCSLGVGCSCWGLC